MTDKSNKDTQRSNTIHVSGRVAKFEVALSGIKSVTLNFEELDLADRKAVGDIVARTCQKKRAFEEEIKNRDNNRNTEEEYEYKDHQGRNIYKGDIVEILTDGKLGKIGDLGDVYKLSNNGVVCYTLRNKKSVQGYRKAYNLAIRGKNER